MPMVIFVIAILALSGGLQKPESTPPPENESDIIVSTEFGGLSRAPLTGSRSERQPEPRPQPAPVSEAPQEEVEIEPLLLPPIAETLSAQNISFTRATMRGRLTFPDATFRVATYYVVGASRAAVLNQSSETTRINGSSRASANAVYTGSVSRLDDDTRYYYAFCYTYENEDRCGQPVSFDTVEDVNARYSFPRATTLLPSTVNAETAVIEGSYQSNDAERITTFFVYGESRTDVSAVNSFAEYDDVRERGDDLQKVRVSNGRDTSGEAQREIDDLERSTTYYYRFCVAYDDEETGIVCGSTRSFETKDRQRDNPTIGPASASFSGNTAVFSARLDMEDYLDGHAFVAYGTSQSSVEDVASRSKFTALRQSGDELQLYSIDADFDGSDSVTVRKQDLLQSEYYYRFCIEYEAEDVRGRTVSLLECGRVDTASK